MEGGQHHVHLHRISSTFHVFAACQTGRSTPLANAVDVGKVVAGCACGPSPWEDGELVLNRNPEDFASMQDTFQIRTGLDI
ncbi:MAG TPA: hypothetical protein VF393_02885 [archaeon]